MRILFFGSYDAGRHPRIRVLIQGLRACGADVVEHNLPLGVSTARRVRLVREPWRLPAFGLRLLITWLRLIRGAGTLPEPDVVIVGYLGHWDVHLARRLWSEAPLVLDFLVSLGGTARDRRIGGSAVRRALEWVDRAALAAADLTIVDTEQHRAQLPSDAAPDGVVVPVGASDEWFSARASSKRAGPLRIVFFGLYTPLQGAPVIGDAIAKLSGRGVEFLMIGRGQELDETRRRAGNAPGVTWVDWVDPENLPKRVSRCDVCLGIFGTRAKAKRVVPNKVYQGAAAGLAVVTSDTAPQRRALRSAGIFVPPGDARSLAGELHRLVREPEYLTEKRAAAYQRAREAFRPEQVVTPLWERLVESVVQA